MKADQNRDPWTNGDCSLATADSRWMSHCRGPIYSDYNSEVRAKDDFITRYKPLSSEEGPWRPQFLPGQETTSHVTQGMAHHGKFQAVVPPGTRQDTIVRGQKVPPPISIQDPDRPPGMSMKDDFHPKKGQRPEHKTILGGADSA